MLKTLELFKHKLIKGSEISDFKQGEDFYFLKIKAIIIDNSELRIKEYVSEKEYLYSYHWQDENGNLRIRWDNSPHHKHTPKIEQSKEMSMEDVLRVIEEKLKRKSFS